MYFPLFAWLFFEKTQGIAIALAALCHAKTVTFYNISLITEDIYMKLGVYVHYHKSNPCYQGSQFKMHFFLFQNNAPFST